MKRDTVFQTVQRFYVTSSRQRGCSKSKTISPYVQFLLDFHNVKSLSKQVHFSWRSYSITLSLSLLHCSPALSLFLSLSNSLISPWLSIRSLSLTCCKVHPTISEQTTKSTTSSSSSSFSLWMDEIEGLFKVPEYNVLYGRVEPIIIKRKKRSTVCTWHS